MMMHGLINPKVGTTVHMQYDCCLPSSFDDTTRSHSWSGYCKCENQVDSMTCAGKWNSLPPGITHTLHLSELRYSKMTLGLLLQRHIYNEWYRL